MSPSEPAQPLVPRAAASMAVIRSGSILLIQRGTGEMRGLWSLPGGHIEPGERARDAARREVREETSIEADPVALVDLHDVILRAEDDRLRAHYLIAVFAGRWLAGEPVAGSDAADARFVPMSGLADLPLTPGAVRFIEQAAALLAVR